MSGVPFFTANNPHAQQPYDRPDNVTPLPAQFQATPATQHFVRIETAGLTEAEAVALAGALQKLTVKIDLLLTFAGAGIDREVKAGLKAKMPQARVFAATR